MMAKAAAKKGQPRKKGTGRTPFPLHRRAAPPPAESLRNLRPRRRRRPLRDYSEFDSDDFDDEEEEENDRGRRKLKLVLKLPHITKRGEDRRPGPPRPPATPGGHVSSTREEEEAEGSSESYAEGEDMEEESEEEEEAMKPPKKRRIDGCDDGVCSDGSAEPEKRRKHVVPRPKSSISGLSSNSFTETPMPERKTLEEILDKLQKKDTYGVFAEPVDPEELPDYHDVIEHPMDFGTVRRKLASVAYRSFEQFEDDVFLICSNAMQYNAPDTIYFRQASSIQDMARKNFQKLRDNGKCVETMPKSEEKIRFNSMEKKPLKKSLPISAQEPFGSDSSSAATLASAGDACTGLSTPDVFGAEAPVVNRTADGTTSPGECKSEVDELLAKGLSSKIGRKQLVVDENRRATYDISDQQPEIESDALLDVLESETKQLVPVGLHAEYSYARSLARFAASLGPIAWEIASKRIEKALPAGVKFGCGWVDEYEPLLTPILSFGNHTQPQPGYNLNPQFKVALRKDKKTEEESQATRTVKSKVRQLGHKNQIIPKKPDSKSNYAEERKNRERTTELKQRLFGVTAEIPRRTSSTMLLQQQEQVTINSSSDYTNSSERTWVCHASSSNNASVETALQRPEFQFEVATSRSAEIVSGDRDSLQPEPLKHPDSVTTRRGNNVFGMDTVGKVTVNCGSNRLQGFISKRQSELVGNCHSRDGDQQGMNQSNLGDLPSKMFLQSNISEKWGIDSSKQFTMNASPSDRENLSTVAAARAWMSIGGSAESKSIDGKGFPSNNDGPASFYGSAWKSPSSASSCNDNSGVRPVPQVFRQPNQVTSEESHIQRRGLVIFPQLVGADLSRFCERTQWQGLVPHTRQKQHKDMLPPDLNISFQSPGSPVRQSSGVLVDAQQPDLALQL